MDAEISALFCLFVVLQPIIDQASFIYPFLCNIYAFYMHKDHTDGFIVSKF